VCRNSIRLRPFLYPDQTAASYVYDLVGKIQQVSDPTGTYGFAYDNMGRLIGTTTQYTFLPGHNFQNGYTYDAASNRASLTAPDGSTNSYQYDTLNRLATLTNSLTGQFGFGYDALSRRTQLTRPNGVNTNYNYDSVSHLLSVMHQAGSTTLDGASYGYDFAGNRTSKTNYLNGITSNYGYDAIYELLPVTQGGNTTETYSYDAVGNRLSSTGVPTYSYNSSNELTSNSSGGYTYDNNGNTLTDASGKSYTWDFENRLTQAVVPGTGAVAFKYDPFGRRIQKSSALGTTNYLYDRAKLVAEFDNSGNVLARYTQSKGVDKPLAQLRSGTVSYYQQDGLGSVTSLTNSAGAVAETYTYDSYGKPTASTGTLVNPFQYTAREFDSETDIYYYRARYFDPSAGRFLNQDPIRFGGGTNFYAYTRNNPVIRTDPFGHYSGSGVVGSIYLGPDGVWQNDGSPLPPDLPGGCSLAQLAQSPNACAGPQGQDEPDPWMPPPNPPSPNKCDKGDQPQDEPLPEPDQYQPPPPILSEGQCLTWTLADGWLHGFVIGAAIFGQEEIPIAIGVGSLIGHKIVCGTWLDF